MDSSDPMDNQYANEVPAAETVVDTKSDIERLELMSNINPMVLKRPPNFVYQLHPDYFKGLDHADQDDQPLVVDESEGDGVDAVVETEAMDSAETEPPAGAEAVEEVGQQPAVAVEARKTSTTTGGNRQKKEPSKAQNTGTRRGNKKPNPNKTRRHKVTTPKPTIKQAEYGYDLEITVPLAELSTKAREAAMKRAVDLESRNPNKVTHFITHFLDDEFSKLNSN